MSSRTAAKLTIYGACYALAWLAGALASVALLAGCVDSRSDPEVVDVVKESSIPPWIGPLSMEEGAILADVIARGPD